MYYPNEYEEDLQRQIKMLEEAILQVIENQKTLVRQMKNQDADIEELYRRTSRLDVAGHGVRDAN